MSRLSQLPTLAIFACTTALSLASPTFADLPALPKSHVQLMPDGRHMLVFLSPVAVEEDEGRIAKLPDGREVDLRAMFPASGYYETGSSTPIWTVPWDDKDGWAVSDDGRFLVRFNYYGAGNYGWNGRELSWGLKFYDRGKEIKTYSVAELVDYPTLMEFDSHYQWIGDADDNLTIKEGQLFLHTSTHESYRFDVATGRMLTQHRMWRMLTRIAWGSFATAIVASTVLIVRRRRRADGNRPIASRRLSTTHETTTRPGSPFSFGLRTLLMATTSVAVLCLVIPRWPHIVLLTFVVLTAIFLTHALWRYRRANRSGQSRLRRTTGIGLRYIAAGLAWLSAYILSVAPVLSLVYWLRAPDDVRMAVIFTVYRPIIWIQWLWTVVFSSLESCLQWYDRAWGV